MIKSRRIGLAENVARMGDMKIEYGFFGRKARKKETTRKT
jgi:hypothetical protein